MLNYFLLIPNFFFIVHTDVMRSISTSQSLHVSLICQSQQGYENMEDIIFNIRVTSITSDVTHSTTCLGNATFNDLDLQSNIYNISIQWKSPKPKSQLCILENIIEKEAKLSHTEILIIAIVPVGVVVVIVGIVISCLIAYACYYKKKAITSKVSFYKLSTKI